MDAQHAVRSLQDLSIDASFKNILATLNQCYDFNSEEGITRSSGFSAPHAAELCGIVRNNLNEHLVGLMSKRSREKYVQRFNDYILSNHQTKNHIAVWMFLDAVLNGSFTELEVYNTNWPVPCEKLIPTIVKRCPLLEKLSIYHNRLFGNQAKATEGEIVAVMEKKREFQSSILSLRSLQHLSHLSLDMNFIARSLVLPLLGQSCPSLSHLSLHGYLFDDIDILRLIHGEFANDLLVCKQGPYSPWCMKETLNHCIVPPQYLSPICYSLRELYFIHRDHGSSMNVIPSAELVFALRHLPSLQILDGSYRTASQTALAVEYFLHPDLSWKPESQEKFQKAFQIALKRRSTAPSPPPNLISTFTGKLHLTRLHYVDVNPGTLLAIKELCPMLTDVLFTHRPHNESFFNTEALKSALSGWPKITTLGFDGVSLENMTPILEVFGLEIRNLKFVKCDAIKLTDLALCQKLESLRVLAPNVNFIPHEIGTEFDPATFLPQLTSLHSDCCLGSHSLLFEQKSTLRRIVLHCSHIQTRVEPLRKHLKDSSASTIDTRLESGLKRIWSQLEVLSISQFTHLSMPVWSDLIPHLDNLKLVRLPGRIHLYEPALLSLMRDHLLGRNPPANISLSEVDNQANCKMVQRA